MVRAFFFLYALCKSKSTVAPSVCGDRDREREREGRSGGEGRGLDGGFLKVTDFRDWTDVDVPRWRDMIRTVPLSFSYEHSV